jgi:hypothetical protein
VIFASGKVPAATTGTKQDACVGATGGLGHLHIQTIAVQGDFTRGTEVAGVETEIIVAPGKAEGVGKTPELPLCGGMEGAFGDGVMSDRLSKVERVRNFGHVGIPGADDGQSPAKRSLSFAGLVRFRPPSRSVLEFDCTRCVVVFRPFLLKMFILIESGY